MASHGNISERDRPHVQIVNILNVTAALLLDIGLERLHIDILRRALHHDRDDFSGNGHSHANDDNGVNTDVRKVSEKAVGGEEKGERGDYYEE